MHICSLVPRPKRPGNEASMHACDPVVLIQMVAKDYLSHVHINVLDMVLGCDLDRSEQLNNTHTYTCAGYILCSIVPHVHPIILYTCTHVYVRLWHVILICAFVHLEEAWN